MIRAAVISLALVAGVGGVGADELVSSEAYAAMAAVREGRTAEGVTQLEALSNAGDASAAQALGELLRDGVGGVTADAERACDLFERAAAAGRGDSAHSAAACYYLAWGRQRDFARAANFYRQALDRGFPRSRCALGNMYVRGHGVAADPGRGTAMCMESAEAGDIDAMTDVGEHLLTGQAGRRDPVAARTWFERAAAGGQRNAPFWLGAIYWNGDGVAKDNAEAARWWRMAFDRGRVDAARFLGDEAFVRFADAAAQPSGAWRAPADEAIRWFETTIARDPNQTNRGYATERLAVLRRGVEALERGRN